MKSTMDETNKEEIKPKKKSSLEEFQSWKIQS